MLDKKKRKIKVVNLVPRPRLISQPLESIFQELDQIKKEIETHLKNEKNK